MSRLARRRVLTLAATTFAVLAAPAAAQAATYTVKSGDGGCGGADTACGGLVEAAAAVNAGAGGDTINVSAGTYPGATFNVGGLTITGEPGVGITTTVEFAGAGTAVSKLSKVTIGAPGDGVRVSGVSGLELSDVGIVSADGHGVLVTAGADNKIVRSRISAAAAASSAIRVESRPGGGTRGLTVDSTLAVGGLYGISAATMSGIILQPAPDIALDLRHVSAGGTGNAIKLDASLGASALNLSAGNISATLTDSLAFGNDTSNYGGVLGIGANTATITATRSLTTGDAATVFASPAARNYRLRPDATAAIGQGGLTPGESTSDFEGEDRSATPTDLGGDEFNNAAPVARVAVATPAARAGQPVRFDAGTSEDREAAYGGGIVQYQWNFSDGKTETTTTPTVDHVFPKVGNAAVQLTVVDRQGASSAPVAIALVLIDGTAPEVTIVTPKSKQTIKRITTKTKTVKGKKRKTRARTKIVFRGSATDTSGVASVLLTLEKLPAKTSSAKASQAKTAKCHWYDPKKGVMSRSCLKPVLFRAALKRNSKTGEWAYRVKRNLNAGSYRLTAVGIDKTGVLGNAGGSKRGVVRFTLR